MIWFKCEQKIKRPWKTVSYFIDSPELSGGKKFYPLVKYTRYLGGFIPPLYIVIDYFDTSEAAEEALKHYPYEEYFE